MRLLRVMLLLCLLSQTAWSGPFASVPDCCTELGPSGRGAAEAESDCVAGSTCSSFDDCTVPDRCPPADGCCEELAGVTDDDDCDTESGATTHLSQSHADTEEPCAAGCDFCAFCVCCTGSSSADFSHLDAPWIPLPGDLLRSDLRTASIPAHTRGIPHVPKSS